MSREQRWLQLGAAEQGHNYSLDAPITRTRASLVGLTQGTRAPDRPYGIIWVKTRADSTTQYSKLCSVSNLVKYFWLFAAMTAR